MDSVVLDRSVSLLELLQFPSWRGGCVHPKHAVLGERGPRLLL